MSFGKELGYTDAKDRIFNRVIWDISIVLRETTLTISDSIETASPVESEIVRLVSIVTTEITRNPSSSILSMKEDLIEGDNFATHLNQSFKRVHRSQWTVLRHT